jgi:DNA-binding transcriptional LysR family regulator
MDEIERIERRLRLHDVRVLMSAVEAGSMGKAAKRLHTSQPAVSRAISDLEHALGVPLIDRSPQGVVPTQYGRAIMRRGLAVFDELRQGIKDIEFLADPTAGELRIGCGESIAASLVFPIIDKFARRYPRIAFHVAPVSGPSVFEELTTRNVELVIARMAENAAEENRVVEKLFDDAFVVAAGSQNRWTRRRSIELVELVGEPWTLPPDDSFASARITEAFRASGLGRPRAMVTTISLNLRNSLLATGRFLTMVPACVVARDRYPFLKKLPVKLPDTRTPIAVVTLRNRTLSPLALLFLDNLRAPLGALAKTR